MSNFQIERICTLRSSGNGVLYNYEKVALRIKAKSLRTTRPSNGWVWWPLEGHYLYCGVMECEDPMLDRTILGTNVFSR